MESVGVGRMFRSVCLFVCLCLSVCPRYNLKTNDCKVFKLGIGMTFGYPRNDVIGVERSQGQ